jgi:hypothetical protein
MLVCVCVWCGTNVVRVIEIFFVRPQFKLICTRGCVKVKTPIFFLRKYNYSYNEIDTSDGHILYKVETIFPQSLLNVHCVSSRQPQNGIIRLHSAGGQNRWQSQRVKSGLEKMRT